MPALDEATNLVVRRVRKRAHVAVPSFAIAAEPTQHVGACKMEGGVTLQRLAASDGVDLRQTFARTDRE